MSHDSGFVDLRLNQHVSGTEEGFWPSFTDIMTVVVMIFMLAMVILLIRNMELVNALRATMEAERQAAELARTEGEEKQHLALQLIATENEVSRLRLRLIRMEEQQEAQEIAIASQQRRLGRVTRERDELQTRTRELAEQTARLEDRLQSSEHALEGVKQDFSRLRSRYDAATEELFALRTLQQRQEQELTQARARLREADLQLADARSEFADLKVRYDKLVRPARSPRGRYLVEVRYAKEDGRSQISFRPQDAPQFRDLGREELHRRLDRLVQEHPEGLYIKIIFPEDSGLSYNEAWRFTSELHSQYDYYYLKSQSEQAGPGAHENEAP
jgi:chromosome segregation ATPase